MQCKACLCRYPDIGLKQPDGTPEQLCSKCLSEAFRQYSPIYDKEYSHYEYSNDLYHKVTEAIRGN
jgi:hypothetical protein